MSFGQLLKLALELGNYLIHHALPLPKEEL
jgi:hypothetical protein